MIFERFWNFFDGHATSKTMKTDEALSEDDFVWLSVVL